MKNLLIALLAWTWTTLASAQYAGIHGGTVDDTTFNDANAGVFAVFVGTNNDGVVFALSIIPPEPPTSLTIVYANNQAIVSWPSSVSGWTLQTNADLTKTNWGNYAGMIINNTATNSPVKGNLFFRLSYH